DRFEVFTSTELIGNPLAFFAAVVEIEHRGDGIDAQGIEMKLAQPVQRIRDQKVAHFVAAVVENVSAPIRMLASAWIEMLVQRRAVKTAERERIFRKMSGHPIHDHAHAFLVKMIDEETKIIGRAVTR